MALKLTQLASKPQLIKIILNDKEIVEKFGDELEFWIMDRQPIDQFIKMATMDNSNQGELIHMVNDLVLDEKGNKILGDGEALPNTVMVSVISAVVDRLGK